jgi:uncharacterized protein
LKIRSITFFFDPQHAPELETLASAYEFIGAGRDAFEQAGFDVQTARLATTPFPQYAAFKTAEGLMEQAQRLEADAINHGFDYVSMGPAVLDSPESYQAIPDALAATNSVFFSGMLSTREDGVLLPAVRACAEIIQRASGVTDDGFTNLRFAALANVSPGSPFFPAAYHSGGAPKFALAIESADLAVQAFNKAGSLADGRQALIGAVEENGRAMSSIAQKLAQRYDVEFGGIDFSLAPFPEEERSLGTALEILGAPAVGLHGSLAATAILAEALDRAEIPKAGFSGVMMPVLEDSLLAVRGAEGVLTVMDLLLYSAVCGTGLDTVPLPGDTTAEELAAVLLDVAVLSQRLDKPLTARLMPIPGKKAGDPTEYDFAYFANSRVLTLKALPVKSFFRGDESIHLTRLGG